MFVCTVPRNTEEFGRLHNIEQRLFGDLALPLDVACDIFETRPEIFNAVLDRNGTVVAYTSAFPLRPEGVVDRTDGDITGAELRPSMIYKRRDCISVMFSRLAPHISCQQFLPIQKCILLSSLL